MLVEEITLTEDNLVNNIKSIMSDINSLNEIDILFS
jgi:hypothetical protein